MTMLCPSMERKEFLSKFLEGVQCRMVLVVNFFVFLKFRFVVGICDLVQDVEAIVPIP